MSDELKSLPEKLVEQAGNSSKYKAKINDFKVAADKLSLAMQEPDPVKFAASIHALLQEHDNALVGEFAAQATLLRPDGQQIACEVGAQKMKDEINNPSLQVKNFLRNDHAINGYTKGVVNALAPDYQKGIAEKATQALASVDQRFLTQNPTKNSDGQYSNEYLDQAVDLTNQYVSAIATTPLDEPARQYLKALSDVVTSSSPTYDAIINDGDVTKQKLSQDTLSNAMVLRLGADTLMFKTGEHGQSQLSKDASSIAQRITNNLHTDTLGFIKPAPTVPILNACFNDNNRQQFLSAQKQVNDTTASSGLSADIRQVAADMKQDRDQKLAVMAQQRSELEQTSVAVDQDQAAKKTTVRDMLRGAADRVSSFAQSIKATIVEKVDQVKLDRMESQINNRSSHLSNLKNAFAALDVPAEREQRDQKLKELQSKYNPDAHTKGDAQQMNIADEIADLKTANKLDDRINKNETKLNDLITKKEAHEVKMEMRASLKDKANQVDQPSAMKVS